MSATADTVQLDPMAIQNRADELDQERAEKMVNGLAEGETLPMTGQEYKDLIVRVAGYSDFFRNLDKPLQDEIINRTEQSFQ